MLPCWFSPIQSLLLLLFHVVVMLTRFFLHSILSTNIFVDTISRSHSLCLCYVFTVCCSNFFCVCADVVVAKPISICSTAKQFQLSIYTLQFISNKELPSKYMCVCTVYSKTHKHKGHWMKSEAQWVANRRAHTQAQAYRNTALKNEWKKMQQDASRHTREWNKEQWIRSSAEAEK